MIQPNCAVCKHLSDQLLVLSCSHDPCIECVAQQYFKPFSPSSNPQMIKGQDFYLCSICFELTKLDSSTIQEVKLYNERKKRSGKISIAPKDTFFKNNSIKNQQKTPKTAKECSTNSSYPNTPKLHNFQEIVHYDSQDQHLTLRKVKQSHPACRNHPDQKKSFYCFSCSRNICAECAIHGTHTGHQVQSIKKATNRLKKFYNTIISEIQRYENIVSTQFQQLTKIMNNFKEWNKNQRTNIRSSFDSLYKILIQKEKKLQRDLDNMEREGLHLMENNRLIYEGLAKQLNKNKNQLISELDLDPVHWNFEHLEQEKENLHKIIKEKAIFLSHPKHNLELKLQSPKLVMEAIQTIQDLVGTFELCSD